MGWSRMSSVAVEVTEIRTTVLSASVQKAMAEKIVSVQPKSVEVNSRYYTVVLDISELLNRTSQSGNIESTLNYTETAIIFYNNDNK